MSKRDDFDARLRAYLAAGAKKSPEPDLEERIRARAFGRRFGWTGQILAAAAVLILAIGLGIVARQARLVGVTGSPSPTPVTTPSGKPRATPTPTPQVNLSPYPLLPPSSIQMINATTGWAAGSTTDRILRTSDGGAHWSDVTPGGAPAGTWTTAFLDANQAWIASSLQPGSGSSDFSVELYRTIDGGSSWRALGTIPADQGWPGRLQFVDAQHGWLTMRLGGAAGSEGVAFYGTRDGGLSWIKLSEADSSGLRGHLPLTCSKNAPVFLNATTGWVPGSCGAGGGPYFYVSRDGGRSWNPVRLSVPAGYPADCMCEVSGLRFLDARYGIFVLTFNDGAGQRSLLYSTTDAGASWFPSASLPSNCFAVSFISPAYGWTLDAKRNIILHTGDGGLHWSTLGSVPSSQGVSDLQFVNTDIGWAVGSEPAGDTLVKTLDGGQSWTTQLAPSP
jgi:photosystem II stability/assembly factor-like uncharacterized protein